MEAKKRLREYCVIAGQPRSGKTTLAIRLMDAAHKAGRGVLVYNPGAGDFDKYNEVEFEHWEETASKILDKDKRRRILSARKFEYFNYKGRRFDIKHISLVLKGRKTKVFRMMGAEEQAFFYAIQRHAAGIMLVIDDARPIFRNGLTSQYVALGAKLNHVGQANTPKVREQTGIGLDLYLIFHNLDTINGEHFDYSTRIVQFKTTREAKQNRASNDELEEIMADNYRQLKALPDYSYFIIDPKNLQNKLIKP